MGGEGVAGGLICFLCCVGLLLTVILIPLSIRNVGYSEYGIAYDNLTCQYEDHIYTQGKYVLVPSVSMFHYNKIIVSIELEGDENIQCLTEDGIEIQLDIVFQYQIIKEELTSIFMEFGPEESLRDFLTVTAIDSIMDTCSLSTAQSFYESRGEIELAMLNGLQNDFLLSQCHVVVMLLQLKNIWLPFELEQAIEFKQRSEQDIDNALRERAGALIVAETVLETAKVNADTLIIMAEAEADALMTEAEEVAKSIETVFRNRGSYYKSIMESMDPSMSASQFINDYLYAVVAESVSEPILQI